MPALILPVHGIHPQIPADCFVADNATIVGDVAVLDPYEFRVLQRSRRAVELVQLRVTTLADRAEPRGDLGDEV